MNRRRFLQLTVATAAVVGAASVARAEEIEASEAGIAGDGMTDDTAALQAVLDGGTCTVLNLEAGTYLLSSALFVDRLAGRIAIRGAGPGLTTLRIEAEDADEALAEVGATSESPFEEFELASLRVESGVSPTRLTTSGEIGIRLGAIRKLVLRDVAFGDLEGNDHSAIEGEATIELG